MTVKMMEQTVPLKPAKSGYKANEFFNLEAFKELEGDFYVEPKYDGMRLQAHRKGDEVKLFTDDGSDISSDLPKLAEELRGFESREFILDGELVIYNGQRQHLPHEAIVSAIHKKGPADETSIRYKVFDILWLDGRLTIGLALKERKELLAGFADTEHMHKVKYYESKGGDALVEAIKGHHSHEGSIIKEVNSKYGKGYARDWYKYKRQHELDAEVMEVERTKSGAYIYRCGILNEKGNLVEIGKTFASSIKAEKGDILRVAVDRVKVEEGKPSWLIPKVMDKRSDKREPDAMALIKQLAHSALWEQALAELHMKGEFVLQAHWWGKSSHYDLRLTKKHGWFGFTIPMPGEPSNDGKDIKAALGDGKKLLALKKAYYGGMEWMDYGKKETKEFPAGAPKGNPSKDLTAYMKAVDWGKYELEKRSENEFVIIFQGEEHILDGRYFIIVAPDDMQSGERGSEGEKSERWFMSRAKEQLKEEQEMKSEEKKEQDQVRSEVKNQDELGQDLELSQSPIEPWLQDEANKVVLVTIIRPGVVETASGKIQYSEEMLKNSLSLWDGVACFCDHFNKSVRNIAGVYYSPYYDDGVKARLRFIDDNLYRFICQLIQDREQGLPVPDLGISADINVKLVKSDGMLDVQCINRVVSADIVFSPAAGGSFDRVLNAAGISLPESEQNESEVGSSLRVMASEAKQGEGESSQELVPVSRVRDLQSSNDKLRVDLKEQESLKVKLQRDLGGAVTKYREALLKAYPQLPGELIQGNSIEELDASVRQAEAVVERVKSKLEESSRIPAGAPLRKSPDISTMSSMEKVQYGLQHAPK